MICANEIKIGKNSKIAPTAEIICDRIFIGNNTVITGSTKIHCKECLIGNHNFLNDVWIEGSLNAGVTKTKIGNENLILQNTRLNCNDYLEIGDDVNIGQNVSIWTHASSMDVFKGYPFVKAPVKIGSHIWITAGTTILPGVNVGSNVIIGNSSVVNKDIPNGCFAAGVPAKIIKAKVFPKKMTRPEKRDILNSVVREYKELLKFKSFSANLKIVNGTCIDISVNGKKTFFDCEKRKISGVLNKYSDDFRDFLRYRGIKFFVNSPFKSISPQWYNRALKNQISKLK